MSDAPHEVIPQVVLVGSGQAAWAMGLAMEAASIRIVQVWARHPGRGQALAQALGSRFCPLNTGGVSEEQAPVPWCPEAGKATLLFLAVSDSSLEEVAARFQETPHGHVVHCSGNKGLDGLKPHTSRGLFWPLYNLSQPAEEGLQGAPVVVDASTPELHQILHRLGQVLGVRTLLLPETERRKLHLAAVMTANFNNVLLHWGHRLLGPTADHAVLYPILRQQLDHFVQNNRDPLLYQSGPAWRKDLLTLQNHLDLLAEDPEGTALYRTFSHLIARLRDQSNP